MSKRKHDEASSSDGSEFTNPYSPFSAELATNIIQNGKLTDSFSKRLYQSIGHLVGQMESGLRRDCDESDQSVYTGVTGISLLYLHLYTLNKTEEYLSRGYEYIKRPLQHLKGRRVTFMCGDAGPLAVGCLLYHKMGKQTEAQQCIDKLQSFVRLTEDPSLPDELLYGRVGYLYALLFLQKHLGEGNIDPGIINKVCRCILDSGEKLAKKEKSKSPLLFEWHNKKYVGAAHGMAGILALLMQVKSDTVTGSLPSLIKPTVDYILELRFPSGNFPSSLGNQSDKLIHWCHGAPGVVHMLLQAHKVFGDAKYLSAAVDCGTVVWERGILRKGYGLCHGTAGNAYAFLALYQATKDEQYLYKACKFAEWCMDYGKHGCKLADRPYSLMEGMAGTIYFLSDLLHPNDARFPGLYVT
ncbi:lanC-like protein 2 isoform X1 [Strongylocentrotus purpuratus]|uniref:LanC-like protein 2 n=2 Tax=Strongylocentrotus purpuratus TaxID=7668 RepID=A0A7M7PBH8_STRPU|nr:lanC-like protein 2 isoform X1 [Strongylocentrotus purpuratus]XP_030846677.1 lanC-like protein 2 isoform X1 [Strongylocentrotus purpuratus]